MENDEFKDILRIDFPNYKVDNDKIILHCKTNKNKMQLKRLSYMLSSFVILVGVIALSIVLLNSRIPKDVSLINNSISNLDKIENDEAKMLEIMKIERDIQSISIEKQRKINMEKLLLESNTTVSKLKNSVEWKEYINNDEDYCLLESIFNYNSIDGIDVNKDRFKTETWFCNDENFYIDLLSILDVPYIDLLENFSDEFAHAFSDYTDYYSYKLYLKNNELIDIGVYNSGYARVYKRGALNNIEKCYVSLIRFDTSRLYNFMNNTNLSKYDMELSMVSLIVSDYSNGMSSAIGPSIRFNLDEASFECSIDYGSFEYYKEIKKLTVSSGIVVQWAPSYFNNYGTDEETLIDEVKSSGKSYMDVIIKINEKIVGFIVAEMKYINTDRYIVTVLESILFKDDNNNLKDVELEFVLEKINEVKGN